MRNFYTLTLSVFWVLRSTVVAQDPPRNSYSSNTSREWLAGEIALWVCRADDFPKNAAFPINEGIIVADGNIVAPVKRALLADGWVDSKSFMFEKSKGYCVVILDAHGEPKMAFWTTSELFPHPCFVPFAVSRVRDTYAIGTELAPKRVGLHPKWFSKQWDDFLKHIPLKSK